MSTVIIGGGGPRPQARIVAVAEMGAPDVVTYEIRDDREIVGEFAKLSHANALLPLIQSGE